MAISSICVCVFQADQCTGDSILLFSFNYCTMEEGDIYVSFNNPMFSTSLPILLDVFESFKSLVDPDSR